MIGMVAPTAIAFDAQGLDGFANRLTEAIMAKVPTGAAITFQVKTGGVRGAAKNALIARAHADPQRPRYPKRDPFYLNSKALEGIRFAARGLLSAAGATRRAAEQTIKSLMLISIGDNVQAQRNPDGSRFQQLTARYGAYKERVFGFRMPALRASGDLLGGLKVEVTRSGFE